ncbi:hypothetical protein C8R43DRAFT_1106408 [Mycena crocata]|nr:hypothetical protein C8R43DRAFT_1106408 [Mycena crocata]
MSQPSATSPPFETEEETRLREGYTAPYCSKECQREHWKSTHKRVCGLTKGDGSEISRLWNLMSMNKQLAPMIHAAYIDKFDLLEHPTLDRSFFGAVHVGVEPEKLADFYRIYMDPQTDTRNMRGMFQINDITRIELPNGAPELEPFEHTWKKARTLPYVQNYATASYGVLRIVIEGTKTALMTHTQIPVECFHMMRQNQTLISISVHEGVQELSMDVASCLRYVLYLQIPFEVPLICVDTPTARLRAELKQKPKGEWEMRGDNPLGGP